MRKTPFVLLALCCALAQPLQASEGKPSVAVYDVENRGANLKGETLDRLADYLGSLLVAQGFEVLPRADWKLLHQAPKGKPARPCQTRSCLLEAGRKVAVARLLAPKVIQLGSRCKVILSLYNLPEKATEAGAALSGPCSEGGVVESFEQAFADLARKLTGKPSGEQAAATPPAAPPLEPRESLEPVASLLPELPVVPVVEEPTKPAALLADKSSEPKRNWLRCPLGQTWDGTACTGKPARLSWNEALGACPKGYRLPAREELMGLLEACYPYPQAKEDPTECLPCIKSRKCAGVFGNDRGRAWSSSEVSRTPEQAWHVSMLDGIVYFDPKTQVNQVYCVQQEE